MPLLWRVFVVNSLLLVTATAALALSPMQVSTPIVFDQAVDLVLWLVVLLAANFLVLRPLFQPLRRLAGRMASIDLLRADVTHPVEGSGEVGRLELAFNTMLERLGHERREAAARTLIAQEAERSRIARELHDEVGQLMTGVLFQLKRIAEQATPEQQATVTEAQATVRRSLDDIRRIAQELRPEVLDELGLARALRGLCIDFARRTDIPVGCLLDDCVPTLDPGTELALYRITQEALTNVARHANATHADVSLGRSNGSVVLEVTDDGCGIGDGVAEGGGLRGMRERANVLGAALDVRVNARGGATIAIELPVAGAAR